MRGSTVRARRNEAAVLNYLSRRNGNAIQIGEEVGIAAITVRVVIRRLRDMGHTINRRSGNGEFWYELEKQNEG